MKHLELQRLLAGFLSAATLLGSLSLGTFAQNTESIQTSVAAAEQATSTSNRTLERVNDILATSDYAGYLEKYPDAEFEIITDTYNMTTTVMEGYIYRDGQEAVAGIISLWTLGEVIAEF